MQSVVRPGGTIMRALWKLRKTLSRPWVRTWYQSSKVGWADIPKPVDEPRVSVQGPDPDRVLLIGDGPAMGFGVASHDLALPGHLSRQVASTTGRGVTVELIADPGLTVENIEARFMSHDTKDFDAVVVFLGSSDAARLTAAKVWRERLHCFLRRINEEVPSEVQVLLVAIPPISRMPLLRGTAASLAKRHAPALNEEMRSAAAGYQNVGYLPFSPPGEHDERRYRSSSTYRGWASLISPAVAELLPPPSNR